MNDNPVLRSVLFWGIPFAVLIVVLGYETDWGRGIGSETAATRAPTAAPVTVSLLPEYKIAGGVEARRETVDRVLFNPPRRPAPPATPTAGGGSKQKGLYILTGTTVTGNLATAFLREVKGGKSHAVHKGEMLNGDVVAEVAADHVRIGQGSDAEELQLKIAGGPKSTIQIAQPAPANPAQPVVRPPGLPGGSGQPPPNAANPAVPPAPINPNAPNAQQRPGVASVSEILAERRRAARAAAAAAANQGGAPRSQ